MRKRLFITMSMAGLAMAALGAQKPKTAKTQSKVADNRRSRSIFRYRKNEVA